MSGDQADAAGCFLCSAALVSEPEQQLVIERAEATVTLMNRFPYSSGHVMVAPRRHVDDLGELSVEEGAALIGATQRALRAITAAMQPGGFNVGFNLGQAAGASIAHLHLHVVPRWGSDTNFMPVLADIKVLPEHLEVTAARLREAMGSAAG